MKRLTALALAAATVISATAIAGTVVQTDVDSSRDAARRPERAREAYVPSVNNVLGSQSAGAFVLR
jgi:hypothetical protein